MGIHISSNDPKRVREMRLANAEKILRDFSEFTSFTAERRIVIEALLVEYVEAINANNSTRILARIASLMENFRHKDFLRETINVQKKNKESRVEATKKNQIEHNKNFGTLDSIDFSADSDHNHISEIENKNKIKSRSAEARENAEDEEDTSFVDSKFGFDAYFESDENDYDPLKHNRREIQKKKEKEEAKKAEKKKK